MVASTSASYCDFAEVTKEKTSAPLSVCCAWPRRNTLRRLVCAWMVEVHRISHELADYHVSQMDFPELRRRVKLYVGMEVCLLKTEDGVCPICLLCFSRLVRDHDHATGFARGKLCLRCNSWLGVLELHPERFLLRKRRHRAWRCWVIENAERICAYLSQPPSGIWHSDRVRRKFQACEPGRDAVRIPQETGNGPVTTTPAGAGESRANTRSNSQPNTGDQDSRERLAWAKEQLARARGFSPEVQPLSGLEWSPKSAAVFAAEDSPSGEQS